MAVPSKRARNSPTVESPRESPISLTGSLASNNGRRPDKKSRIGSPSFSLTPPASPAGSFSIAPSIERTLLNESISLSPQTSISQPASERANKKPYTHPLIRSRSEGNAINTGLNRIVENLTEEYIASLKKSLSSIKFILGDIIFEYEYEIEIVGLAREQIIIAQGAAENRGQNATNINENMDTLDKTCENMMTTRDKYQSVKNKIEAMIVQLEYEEPVKAIKLNSLIMFLGNTFERGNAALRLFVHNLFPEDLVDIFTEKFKESGLLPKIDVPAELLDRELHRSMGILNNQVNPDLVTLQEENNERGVQANKKKALQRDFVITYNGELQQEADSPAVRDKILTKLANRIHERYSSPSRNDLETIDGKDIFQYALKYFSYMKQDIITLSRDRKSLLLEILEKLTTDIKLPEDNKIIIAIRKQIQSVVEPGKAEEAIQHSRSPIQKLAIIGYHVMKNIFTRTVEQIAESVQKAYTDITKSNRANVNAHQSMYTIPESLKSLNTNMVMVATDIGYRQAFFKKVYENTVSGSINRDIKRIILAYTGDRSDQCQSQGAEVNGIFNHQEAQRQMTNQMERRKYKRATNLRETLQDLPETQKNFEGGKKVRRRTKRKTVKKRKTKKNNKVNKETRRRNRKTKKN